MPDWGRKLSIIRTSAKKLVYRLFFFFLVIFIVSTYYQSHAAFLRFLSNYSRNIWEKRILLTSQFMLWWMAQYSNCYCYFYEWPQYIYLMHDFFLINNILTLQYSKSDILTLNWPLVSFNPSLKLWIHYFQGLKTLILNILTMFKEKLSTHLRLYIFSIAWFLCSMPEAKRS